MISKLSISLFIRVSLFSGKLSISIWHFMYVLSVEALFALFRIFALKSPIAQLGAFFHVYKPQDLTLNLVSFLKENKFNHAETKQVAS